MQLCNETLKNPQEPVLHLWAMVRQRRTSRKSNRVSRARVEVAVSAAA